jgi:F0F1-type ATP synthase delta subunit
MNSISRRQLAIYAADQLAAGDPPKNVAAQLAAVLKETKRMHESELLARDVALELEHRGQLAQAYITSATPLPDEIRNQLIKFIKSAAAVNEVSVEENVDKSVIGGVKIETAVHSWDKTISRQLTNIREAF